MRVLRRAASDQAGPLAVDLGPVTTFMPASPVVYLAVGGPDLDRLARLRQAVVAGPMLRPDHWPWVPHVTLTDDVPADRIEAALAAMFSYSSATVFDRVVLLEEREHRWQPLADACLGRAAVVAGGGLELEIVEGRVPGPDVVAMAGGAEAAFLAALDTVPGVLEHRPYGTTTWRGGRRGDGVARRGGRRGRRGVRTGRGEVAARRRWPSAAPGSLCERAAARVDRGRRPRVRAEGFFNSASPWIREIRPAVVL